MLKFGTAIVTVVLPVTLLGCSQKSSAPPASPEPATAATPPPATDQSEPMSPASGTTSPDASESMTPTPAEPTAPAAAPLTDPQIVRVVELANSAEIEQAKVAQGKAKNARVKKFAAMMVSDHGKAKQKAMKLGFQAAESPLSSELASESQSMLTSLESTAPADFDRKYIDTQVEAHRRVLSALNERLIPAASDPKLKTLLEEMQTTVDAHLTEAEKIQGELAAATP